MADDILRTIIRAAIDAELARQHEAGSLYYASDRGIVDGDLDLDALVKSVIGAHQQHDEAIVKLMTEDQFSDLMRRLSVLRGS